MPELLHAVQTIAGKLPRREPADLETVRRLLAERADLEAGNDEGWTAFMWAIRCRLDDVAQILAAAGADTSRRRDAELITAAFEGDAELARRCLEGGANPDCAWGGWSPLKIATVHGNAEVVEALILANAAVPPDALSGLGEMGITDYVIDSGESEAAFARVIETLIAHGASPHMVAYDGRPLIDTFPSCYYPNIHRTLSTAVDSLPPPS